MRTTNITNDNLVIQAKNAQDYTQALLVAAKMEENTDGWMVVCSSDDSELWVQVTAVKRGKQAEDFKNEYRLAKAEV
jgi:hypothetical protein